MSPKYSTIYFLFLFILLGAMGCDRKTIPIMYGSPPLRLNYISVYNVSDSGSLDTNGVYMAKRKDHLLHH